MPIKISFGKRHNKSRTSSLMGGILSFFLSGIGFYVLFSEEKLQGGIPFIPEVINTAIGMSLIAFGAVLTALMGVYAFYEFFSLGRKTD